MEDRIIAEFNTFYGSDVDNLSKSKGLVDKYVDQLNEIEEKVNNFWNILCNLFCLRLINSDSIVVNTDKRQRLAGS